MPTKSKPILAILGPTASGKSELAVLLAKKFNGEVVSADSRQVYRGLDIGTGKVPRDRISYDLQPATYLHKSIPHYLLDVASLRSKFSVARYQKLANQAVKKIFRKGKTPIFCGGTGFYLDTVLNQTRLPSVPPNLKLRKKLEKKTLAELFAQLKKLDPARARNIDPQNPRRLIRALEIVLSTRKPVPRISVSPPAAVLKIGIRLPQETLRKRINNRIRKWLRAGLLDEVRNLRGQGLSWSRLNELGLEYKYPAAFLRGEISKGEMIRKMETETWHYAKRQITWFKRDKEIIWLSDPREASILVGKFFKQVI